MGKKSRLKKERRLARMQSKPKGLFFEVEKLEPTDTQSEQSDHFEHCLVATKTVLGRYNPLDTAIALFTSELWPANVGSPIKHIFAWRALLELPSDSKGRKPIASYAEFKEFVEALYQAWPELPMLEDFCSEADWGHIKVRLGREFAPMFYGSCIERTPDFVEAFRITYSEVPKAQGQMNLALAIQARIIDSIPHVETDSEEGPNPGYVEVPTEAFWLECKSAIPKIGADIAQWRNKAGKELETRPSEFTVPITSNSFGDTVMQGRALPFLAVEIDNVWVPISVRSGPSVVIDHWANKDGIKVNSHIHQQLTQFVSERFQQVVPGPITLYIDNIAKGDLPVSCILSGKTGVYLICACDQTSYEQLAHAAKDTYTKVNSGAKLRFRLADGCELVLSKDGISGLSADELKILIVLTQSSTAMGVIMAPQRPVHFLPLADFVTIFDSLNNLEELEQYWKFKDSQRCSLGPFLGGAADLFASFRDTHGVLVDGANSPTYIGLDPSWGTSWRFRELNYFWSLAPEVFPDGSTAWKLSEGTEGNVVLESRSHNSVAYSTDVGGCTVQTLVGISSNLALEDARMIDMFAQLLVDCSYRCRELIADIQLFQCSHVLLLCDLAPSCPVNVNDEIKPIEEFDRVLVTAERHVEKEGLFRLQIDARAVFAGLANAQDGSFEIRCLLETLERCLDVCGSTLPLGFAERLKDLSSKSARYHIQVVHRNVDVPDYAKPIIPSPTDYKLARKHLAEEIKALGLTPGRYELIQAKAQIDPASARLRSHIESRLASLDRHQCIQAFIQQHDALLFSERKRILRTRQSLAHEVEYDRLDAIEQARKDFGAPARHYRYLLEKIVSSPISGSEQVSEDVLRELVSLVDWFKVLTSASDVLHNDIDVGGVVIDDSYIPEVFYSDDHEERETHFARVEAQSKLGVEVNKEDTVEGAQEELLNSEPLKTAFESDLGFDLNSMLTALVVLSQAQRHGLGDELSFSYYSTPERLARVLSANIEGLMEKVATKIVSFLTLSPEGVRQLSGRNVVEADVPYWEHKKRLHRYAIRPLVPDGSSLIWGAETASRALNIWMSAVRDGFLPADFNWPHVEPVIRKVKQGIEKQLEIRTEEIFRRYTPYVEGGIDFFRKFRSERFEDVGDFDTFAYWPEHNLLITVECKYNQPAHTMKDSRRLRDKIFGKSENDNKGQISKIFRRRLFLEKNTTKLLDLLKWPITDEKPVRHVELYVSRDVYYWMVHPPYSVPTQFIAVDALDSWLNTELNRSNCENA